MTVQHLFTNADLVVDFLNLTMALAFLAFASWSVVSTIDTIIHIFRGKK